MTRLSLIGGGIAMHTNRLLTQAVELALSIKIPLHGQEPHSCPR